MTCDIIKRRNLDMETGVHRGKTIERDAGRTLRKDGDKD